MTKYKRPMARNIADLKQAAGLCSSGINPTEQCNPTGAVNSAYCRVGTYHSPTSCGSNGIGATTCSPTGLVAGLEQ